MNHGQKPVTDTSVPQKHLSRWTTVALVVAVGGALLGYAVLLVGLLWKIDQVTPTTAQAAASSPADKSSQTMR